MQSPSRSTTLTLATAALALFVFATAASAADNFEKISDVVYIQRGELNLLADVYMPEGEGPFPAVLVVHGGAWRSGDKNQLFFVAGRLVRAGYTCVAINYRLAPEHKFPAQVEDCKAAVRWMREHAAQYKIDPNRIAGWGYSAGAHLVSMLGTTDKSHGLEGPTATADSPSTRLQAVVAGGTPCDFRTMPELGDGLAFWLGARRSEKPEVYKQASPMVYVSDDDPPFFFYHAVNDELVPLESAQAMQAALEQAGVAAELYEIEKGNHIGGALNGAAIIKGTEFLDRVLKK
jgi:acetyl esterase/lipase